MLRLPGGRRRADRHGSAGAAPQTIATAIRIGNPASWQQALDARDESGGVIQAVTDRQILAAYRLLATQEAVFVEPASAASVAGLLQAHEQGLVPRGQPGGLHRHRQRPQGPGVGHLRCAQAARRSRRAPTPPPRRSASA